MASRKVAKRACDGCKIRKIKCSETQPCTGCVAAGVACTFLKHPTARGPRRLRKSTLDEISNTQKQWEQLAVHPSEGSPQHFDPDGESSFAPSKVAALALQLCVYRLRCYPIWPIIKVERLVASLQKTDPDIEVFALAYAVAAATIAQIRTKSSSETGGVTAEMMEMQCQSCKVRRNKYQPPDLTTVRIPFFLHVYHENLEPGGLKSITYLREAIAVAHMIGLHRESYYVNVEPAEQEIRRRTLWLLFVTERGVSILHKLPVTLKTKLAFPSLNDTDEREVLLAYQKLIGMFWHFDQAGVFDLLDSQDFDLSKARPHEQKEAEALDAIRKHLDETPALTQTMNEVQALDILITRAWMRIILWRLAESHGFFSQGTAENSVSSAEPILIAREMLKAVSQAPRAAIEAHGPSFETKVFEIASTVADAIALETMDGYQFGTAKDDACDILSQMESLLASNTNLLHKLRLKTPQSDLSRYAGQDSVDQTIASSYLDDDIEQQLDDHGFNFTDPIYGRHSPYAHSLADHQELGIVMRNRVGGSSPHSASPGYDRGAAQATQNLFRSENNTIMQGSWDFDPSQPHSLDYASRSVYPRASTQINITSTGAHMSLDQEANQSWTSGGSQT